MGGITSTFKNNLSRLKQHGCLTREANRFHMYSLQGNVSHGAQTQKMFLLTNKGTSVTGA